MVSRTALLLYITIFTLCHSSIPDWTSAPVPSITLFGDDCLSVRWSTVTNNGGAPVLCYEVARGENSVWYTIVDCGSLGPGFRHTRTCGFSKGVAIQFKVYAINKYGVSLEHVSDVIYLEWLLTGPASTILDPGPVSRHTSGDLPSISVRSYFPSTPIDVLDSISTDRLFVARFSPRCKVDLVSRTVTLPLEPGDTYYVADVIVDSDAVPVFTKPLQPSTGGAGLYYRVFDTAEGAPSGEYSLLVSSLEPGGLFGQYWSNPFFNQVADLERKDETIDFAWAQNPLLNITATGVLLYDLVSIRWTGFVKSEFKELYSFSIQSSDYMQVWFDEVLVIDKLLEPCSSSCTWSAEVGGLGRYHHIRIDYYHSKGFGQTIPAGIVLKWSSLSQSVQVIPATNLFKGVFIGYDLVDGTLPSMTFVYDIMDGLHCLVTYPLTDVVAGELISVFVQSRDAFDQDRLTMSETFYLTLNRNGGATVEVSTVLAVSGQSTGTYVAVFSLTIAGTYVMTIVNQEGNAIRVNDRMTINIVASQAVTVSSVVSVTPSVLIANEPISVSFVVQDTYGNALTVEPEYWPDVYIVAEWLYDSVSTDRLGGDWVDFETRNNLLGTFFYSTNDRPVWVNGAFTTTLTILLAGEFTVRLSAGVSLVTATLDWQVHGNPNINAANSVIASKPFPPSGSLPISGQPYSVDVQLRDEFFNVIDLPPVGIDVELGSMHIRILHGQWQEERAFCDPKAGFDGMYVCVISPVLAIVGETDVSMSVRVNGVEASYIPSQAGGALPAIPGPFSIAVSVGPAVGSMCVLSGYAGEYTGGIYRETNLLLRDTNGNQLEAVPDILPTILVNLIEVETVVHTLDQNTFTFSNDGSVNIPLGWDTISPSGGWTLEVLVNSIAVPIPSITRIVIVKGRAVAAQTVCTAISDTQEAGFAIARECQPRDTGGNEVYNAELFLHCSHKNLADSLTPVIDRLGVYNAGPYDMDGTLNRAGVYSVYCDLWQQGGLLGEYFVSNDFVNRIAVELVTVDKHSGDSKMYYNSIDSSFIIDEPSIILHGVAARSIRWSGYIIPPGSLNVRFTLAAAGGVRISINDILWVDKLDELDIDLYFDVAFVTGPPAEFIIEYVVGAVASFSLRWDFPSISTPFPMHANSLLAPLNILAETQLVTVTPSYMGNLANVIVPSTMIHGVVGSFTIESKDRFGNRILEDSVCYPGLSGTYGTCLFEIAVVPDDGSDFIVSYTDNGIYQVDVSMNTDGPKYIHVSVITGPNPADRDPLLGSPVFLEVS